MSFATIQCVQELNPVDKFDKMHVMQYKGKQKPFSKIHYLVILKDAELYIFEKQSQPPKFQFPLDHCQAVAVSKDTIKVTNDIANPDLLFKLTVKDGAEFLFLPETFEKQQEWVKTVLNYSENYKIYLKHKINTKSSDEQPCVRVMIMMEAKNKICEEIAKTTLSHLARVTKVIIDEEGVGHIYGQFVSPIAVLDALECAGFKASLLAIQPTVI